MVFLDTHILVYASIEQDRRKQMKAAQILMAAKERETYAISLQVLREFANVMYHKSDFTHREIREMVRIFRALPCIPDSDEQLFRGMEIKERHGLQFYDALVVASAEAAGCDTIYSEDLSDGAVYEGIRVENPFADA